MHNTRGVGKIVLLAVAAAGIYCQFKSVTSLRTKDAGQRKDSLACTQIRMLPPQTSNTLASYKKELPLPVIGFPARDLSVDRRVEVVQPCALDASDLTDSSAYLLVLLFFDCHGN